jgi:hypothetical protein
LVKIRVNQSKKIGVRTIVYTALIRTIPSDLGSLPSNLILLGNPPNECNCICMKGSCEKSLYAQRPISVMMVYFKSTISVTINNTILMKNISINQIDVTEWGVFWILKAQI